MEFAQGPRGVLDVADAEGDGDDVERGVGILKMLGVALGVGDLGSRFLGQFLAFFACVGEHGGGEVDAHDFRGWGAGGKGLGEVARAAGDIENVLTRLDLGQLHGKVAPADVLPEAVDTVVEVVGVRDGGEHAADLGGFVGVLVGVGLAGEFGVGPSGGWLSFGRSGVHPTNNTSQSPKGM